MIFPEKLDEEDMELFIKELKLAGLDVLRGRDRRVIIGVTRERIGKFFVHVRQEIYKRSGAEWVRWTSRKS